MRMSFRSLRHVLSRNRPVAPPRRRLSLEVLEDRCVPSAGFVETNLVSDIQGLAPHTDMNLVNPWGFSETSQGQFRVSANGTGLAPLFDAQGNTVGGVVVIPPPPSSPGGTASTPNGNITNPTSDFVISAHGKSAPATVLFSTEDGTIAGWNPNVDGTFAVLGADNSASGAVYKLLAMGSNSQGNFLYATNFHAGTIDVFDKNFHQVTLGTNGFGTFTDPKAPAGFAPFGVKDINGTLFVSYAKQKPPDNHDDQEGPGNGFIDEFDTSGNFIKRFASGTAAGGTLTQLNSPIGMAVAPTGFGPGGKFGGALLVGNFGDSHVSAFDLKTGAFLGQLSDAQGHPLTLNGGVGGSDTKGLWGIAFGNGKGGAGTNSLFFAAGINDEADGLFGKVTMTHGDGDHDHDDRGTPPQQHHQPEKTEGDHDRDDRGTSRGAPTAGQPTTRALDQALATLASTILADAEQHGGQAHHGQVGSDQGVEHSAAQFALPGTTGATGAGSRAQAGHRAIDAVFGEFDRG